MYETKRQKLIKYLQNSIRELKGKEIPTEKYIAMVVIETGAKEQEIKELLKNFMKLNEIEYNNESIKF